MGTLSDSDKLSPRESIILRERLKGKSKADAMRAAGYAESTIHSLTREVCARVEEKLQDVMERKGLTADAFTDKLVRMLECGDPRVEFNCLKLWSDLRGWEPPKQHHITGDVNVTVAERRADQNRVFARLGGID